MKYTVLILILLLVGCVNSTEPDNVLNEETNMNVVESSFNQVSKDSYAFITSNRVDLKVVYFETAPVSEGQTVYTLVDRLNLETSKRELTLVPSIVEFTSGKLNSVSHFSDSTYVFDISIFYID